MALFRDIGSRLAWRPGRPAHGEQHPRSRVLSRRAEFGRPSASEVAEPNFRFARELGGMFMGPARRIIRPALSSSRLDRQDGIHEGLPL